MKYSWKGHKDRNRHKNRRTREWKVRSWVIGSWWRTASHRQLGLETIRSREEGPPRRRRAAVSSGTILHCNAGNKMNSNCWNVCHILTLCFRVKGMGTVWATGVRNITYSLSHSTPSASERHGNSLNHRHWQYRLCYTEQRDTERNRTAFWNICNPHPHPPPQPPTQQHPKAIHSTKR